MKSTISVLQADDIEELAAEVIEIYEAPPEGANPEDDDDPHLGEDGILFVETDELEEAANELPTKSSTLARQLEIRRKIEEAQEAKRFREEFGMSLD